MKADSLHLAAPAVITDLDLGRAHGVIGDRQGITAFADCIRKQERDAMAALKELVEAANFRDGRDSASLMAAWKAVRDLVKESP